MNHPSNFVQELQHITYISFESKIEIGKAKLSSYVAIYEFGHNRTHFSEIKILSRKT